VFFAEVGRDVLASEDPVKAMKQYLGLIGRVGRPSRDIVKDHESIQEDIELIDEVRALRCQGFTENAALDQLAKAYVSARDRKKYSGPEYGGPEEVVKERLKKRYGRALKSLAVREALAAKAFDLYEAQQTKGTEIIS
jgi:hypothetical protein